MDDSMADVLFWYTFSFVDIHRPDLSLAWHNDVTVTAMTVRCKLMLHWCLRVRVYVFCIDASAHAPMCGRALCFCAGACVCVRV